MVRGAWCVVRGGPRAPWLARRLSQCGGPPVARFSGPGGDGAGRASGPGGLLPSDDDETLFPLLLPCSVPLLSSAQRAHADPGCGKAGRGRAHNTLPCRLDGGLALHRCPPGEGAGALPHHTTIAYHLSPHHTQAISHRKILSPGRMSLLILHNTRIIQHPRRGGV